MSEEWMKVRSTPTEKEARGPIETPRKIDTREGTVWAEVGDYVVREKDGNVYPISPEKFQEYYNVIEESGDE